MLIPVRNSTQGACSRHRLSLCYCIILSLTTSGEVLMAVTSWAASASLQWVWAWFWYIKATRLKSIAAILSRPNAITLTRLRAGSLACRHLQDVTLWTKAIESTSLICALLDTNGLHGLSYDAGDNEVSRWRFRTMAHLIISLFNFRIPLAKLFVRISHALSNHLNFILFALTDWCLLILLKIRGPFLLFENWVSQIFADIALSFSLVLDYLWICSLTEAWRLIWF